MSIRAMNWAMEQRTDGPSAQSVLFVIADRANEHGVCRHADPDTIAEKTRQSRATVFRRLEEMQRVGLLTRFTRHLEGGGREYEVRLALALCVNYRVERDRSIVLLDADDEPVRTLAPDAVNDADDAEGQSQIETHTVAPVRPGESQSCDPHKSPSKNPKDIPPSPQGGAQGGAAHGEEAASEQVDPDGWADFQKAWEADDVPIGRVSIAKQIVAALSADERERATRAARGYLVHRGREKKPGMKMAAQTFLREPDAWPSWAKLAPPPAEPVTFVPADSDVFRGIQVLRAIRGKPPLQAERSTLHGADGAHVLGDVDPTVATLAPFALADGRVDPAGWTVVEDKSREFFAWCDRIHRWTGERPPPRMVVLDDVVKHTLPAELGGRTVEAHRKVNGLKVPTPWPPKLSQGGEP